MDKREIHVLDKVAKARGYQNGLFVHSVRKWHLAHPLNLLGQISLILKRSNLS